MELNTFARQTCHCGRRCGDLLSSYRSPRSLQHLEVSGQGHYLFSKSLHTRSASKQTRGLTFSRTCEQNIWLSLKIIRMAKPPPCFISLCGPPEAGSVTACWLIAHVVGVDCLINWKSWNIKVTCFLSCLNGGSAVSIYLQPLRQKATC